MAISRKEEARALNDAERELVAQSGHPAVQQLTDADLARLIRLVREHRDKAQGQLAQRRREMSGKGAPRAATPAAGDAGSNTKVAVLAMAMRRLNGEAERRRQMAANAATVAGAHHALALKQAAATHAPTPHPNSRVAWMGMKSATKARSEALMRPAERGRQRAAAGVAQAKRDGR